jgi:hypothetical protein
MEEISLDKPDNLNGITEHKTKIKLKQNQYFYGLMSIHFVAINCDKLKCLKNLMMNVMRVSGNGAINRRGEFCRSNLY